MTAPSSLRPVCVYRLRVEGHLDDHWSGWFGALAMTRDPDGTTSITGPVVDQAELHGLLTRIRDLGVVLISVALVDRTVTRSGRGA